MNTFGEKLRQWRDARGVTAYSVEKEAGIDRSNLRQIETGARPASEDYLRRLAAMPKMEITYETLKVWQRLDNITYEEKIELLNQLTTESQLLPLIQQIRLEKERGHRSEVRE